MRPVVCMITDRSRMPGEHDDERLSSVVDRVAMAARAGVHLIQVRERDLDGGPLLAFVRRCVEAVRGTQARVVVNDRLDVALAAGAHGVHLRGDSMPARRVRELTPPGFLVGRSVHQRDEATQVALAGGVDYLIFGPVFATASKPGVAAAGLDALAGIASASGLPVLAVGGITAGTLRDTAAARRGRLRPRLGCFTSADTVQLRTTLNTSLIMDAGFRTPLLDFFRRGEVARDIRLLAAQGALAPRAHEQLGLLMLLVCDADPEIAAAAETPRCRRFRAARSRPSWPAPTLAARHAHFFAARGIEPAAASRRPMRRADCRASEPRSRPAPAPDPARRQRRRRGGGPDASRR